MKNYLLNIFAWGLFSIVLVNIPCEVYRFAVGFRFDLLESISHWILYSVCFATWWTIITKGIKK